MDKDIQLHSITMELATWVINYMTYTIKIGKSGQELDSIEISDSGINSKIYLTVAFLESTQHKSHSYYGLAKVDKTSFDLIKRTINAISIDVFFLRSSSLVNIRDVVGLIISTSEPNQLVLLPDLYGDGVLVEELKTFLDNGLLPLIGRCNIQLNSERATSLVICGEILDQLLSDHEGLSR